MNMKTHTDTHRHTQTHTNTDTDTDTQNTAAGTKIYKQLRGGPGSQIYALAWGPKIAECSRCINALP